MTERNTIIEAFVKAAGWSGAKRVALAGDASFRRYDRVFLGKKQAVLMDAPPEKEDIRPFIRVADVLTQSHDLSAPLILSSDIPNGLILLEDLGDDLFARVLERKPALEKELYGSAADVLVRLYEQSSTQYNDVPLFDMPRLLQQVALIPEWFLPVFIGHEKAGALKSEYLSLWQSMLTKLPDLGRVLVLYDFHAENLLWLPEREGAKRAGLLDFQDAMLGSPAYDMVSFLEDARRDVAPETVSHVIAHYLAHTGIAREDFMLAYALLGAQRNSRIIGTFVRLAVRDGKERYLSYLPRVWQHLERDLSHPVLKPLKDWMDHTVKQEWRGVINPAQLRARATA